MERRFVLFVMVAMSATVDVACCSSREKPPETSFHVETFRRCDGETKRCQTVTEYVRTAPYSSEGE